MIPKYRTFFYRFFIVTALLCSGVLRAQNSDEIPEAYFDTDSVYALTFRDPVLAERILDQVDAREMLPAYDRMVLRGDFYYNCGRLTEAHNVFAAALNDAHIDNDSTKLIEVYYRLSLIHSAYNEVEENFNYLDSLRIIAEATNDYTMQSYVLSNIALQMFSQQDQDGGIEMMREAIETAKKANPATSPFILTTIYEETTSLVGLLISAERFDEALTALSEAHEELKQCKLTYGNLPEFDALKKLYLSQYAFVEQKLGFEAEAEQAYREWRKIPERSNADYVMCSYMALSGRYHETLEMTELLLNEYYDAGDSCSYQVEELLRSRISAQRGLGQYQQLADTYERLLAVESHIKHQEQQIAAREYAAKFNTQLMQTKYEQQRADTEAATAKNQQLLLYLFVVLFVAIIIGSFLLIRYFMHKTEISAMRQAAEVDYLTKIHNRYGGSASVDALLRQRQPGAFILFDCDKFKSINDNYGHSEGDKVLISIAQALRKTFANEIVFRLGGDEFGLYLSHLDCVDQEHITAAVQPFFDLISQIALSDGLMTTRASNTVHITLSAGAAIYDGLEPTTLRHLYQQADQLLYRNKMRPDRTQMAVFVE